MKMKFKIKGSRPALITTLLLSFLSIRSEVGIVYHVMAGMFTAVTFICISIESLKDEEQRHDN